MLCKKTLAWWALNNFVLSVPKRMRYLFSDYNAVWHRMTVETTQVWRSLNSSFYKVNVFVFFVVIDSDNIV